MPVSSVHRNALASQPSQRRPVTLDPSPFDLVGGGLKPSQGSIPAGIGMIWGTQPSDSRMNEGTLHNLRRP